MRVYRDLTAGEGLRAGDEIYSGREWIPIAEQSVGVVLSGRELLRCRRPVDLPMLQRVTPEAIKELEWRGSLIMLFKRRDAPLYRYEVAVYNKQLQGWFGDLEVNPLDWQWYIEVDTIPEVQQ